jgi:hypothetical protein
MIHKPPPRAGVFIFDERPLLAVSCLSKTKIHHHLTDRLQVQSSHVGVI